MTKGNASQAALWVRAETRFRQLCALGVGGLVTAPTLLSELCKVVPGGSAVIFYQRPGERIGIYQEWPEGAGLVTRPEVQRALYADGYGEHDKIVFQPFRYLVHEQAPSPARQTQHGFWNSCARPEAPRASLKPTDQHSLVRLQVRDGSGYIGMVGVYHGARDPEFGCSEIDTLRRLEPFLVRALTPRQLPGVAEVENGYSAMLVVDALGRRRWVTAAARAMLALALGSVDAPLPAAALRSVRALLECGSGDPQDSTPAWCCRSRWGRFEFRAHRLEPDSPQGEPLAGITVTRFVPLPLRLFEALGELDMAPRQSEVALRLALGNTQEQIATDLRLSRATVVYHRRQIYNRLGVDTREQLLDRMLHLHHGATQA